VIPLAILRSKLAVKADQDQLVEMLRDTVVAQWESATGGLWNRRDDYEQLIVRESWDDRRVWLTLCPVEEVTLVEERETASNDWVALDAANYELESFGLKSASIVKDSALLRYVRVTYTGGFVAVVDGSKAVTPADVAQALYTQAQFLVRRFSDDLVALKAQNIEGGAGTFEQADYHPLFVVASKRWRRNA